jgi:hypothetical protein
MLLLACHVAAVRPTPANYGSNIITSTVDAFCIGTFTVGHEMEWQHTDDGTGLGNNPLDGSRVDYTYREATLGYEGTATYLKDFSMNGGNVQQGMDNLNVNHIIDFENSPNKNGILLFDEMARMDIWGSPASDPSNPICIFAQGGSNSGAYSGSVTVGSKMRVEEVSAIMSIGSSSISDSSRTPVNLRYAFDAEGIATDPKDDLATGSATVFSNVDMHIYNSTSPMVSHIRDTQSVNMVGDFDLATTFGYSN